MKCEQTSKRSLPVLAALGLILATTAAALSAPPRRVPGPRRVIGPRARAVIVPAPGVRPRAVVKPGPNVRVRVAPRAAVVVPGYRPRPVIRAGGAVMIYRGRRIVRPATPPMVVSPAELAVVPAREFTQAPAYQVISVGDDYLLTLSIEGKPTPVRLLGVEPLLLASAEGQPGAVPAETLLFVRNLLAGELVYLEDDPALAASDSEGIRVAYLHRAPDGLLVNLEIIRQGYGLAAEGYAFQYRDAFTAYQTRAQQIGKGIWRGLESTPTAH